VTTDLCLRRAEVGGALTDVWVRDGVIVASPVAGAREIDCGGAALLPGLHDHHIHLLATAVAAGSVQCGPPAITTAADLGRVLRTATPQDGWVRGIGYHEAVAGELDAATLDGFGCPWPVRVQHRSGALWVLNSAGMEALGLRDVHVDGVERDADDRPTGRLWRADAWLRARLGAASAPDLAVVSAELASYGITGVTDATPDLDRSAIAALTSGQLAQRLTLLGSPASVPGADCGPFKIVLGDHDLPTWDRLLDVIDRSRPRAVALHSVTRTSLLLALAVLDSLGAVAGDRIEHAAVAPPEAITAMARLGLTVVTQPSLVGRRGADYLDRVDAHDRPWLWPVRSLLDGGVGVGLSSDAPYGDLNPWASIAAAVARQTPDGRVVGESERVSTAQALRGYLSSPRDPGGPERLIAPGAPADLALLDRSVAAALADPAQVRVQLTAVGGSVVHEVMS
jgi:predicted amidohydrolase YtcJ